MDHRSLKIVFLKPSARYKLRIKESLYARRFCGGIKRIIDSLKEKQYIRRVDGKRYGKWEVFC